MPQNTHKLQFLNKHTANKYIGKKRERKRFLVYHRVFQTNGKYQMIT